MSESEENEGNIGLHVMISVRGPWSLSWPADSDAKLPARCVPHPGFINPTIGSVYFSCLVLFSLSRLPPLFSLLLLSKSSLPCKSEAISEGIRHDACTKTQWQLWRYSWPANGPGRSRKQTRWTAIASISQSDNVRPSQHYISSQQQQQRKKKERNDVAFWIFSLSLSTYFIYFLSSSSSSGGLGWFFIFMKERRRVEKRGKMKIFF